MDKPKSKNWRTRLLIYPKFQIKFAIINFGITVTSSFAVYWLASRSFGHLRAEGLAQGLSADHGYFKLLDTLTGTLYGYLVGATIIGMVVSFFVTMMLSHKLAGPIVRLHSYFESIIKGNKPVSIYFRKNDFFRDLPILINQAVEKLQEDKSSDKKELKVKEDWKKAA